MAWFSGVQTGSGSFKTGTLTLGITSYYGWTFDKKQPGDEWTTDIVLTNTGSLGAKYLYEAFYITENTGPDSYGIADKIQLTSIDDWCSSDGLKTLTFDATTSNEALSYWYNSPITKGYVSLYDLANIAMTGGGSTTTSLQQHTVADTGVYLPSGQQCEIILHFKLLEDAGNTYQDRTCSFYIKFIATNAPSNKVDAAWP
jgi:hypothetical protein